MILLGTNVISKTINLLKAFTDKQNEWGVNELARFLNMPVSSTHRMLNILKDENILTLSESTGKYCIGEEFIRMASIVSANSDIKSISRPYMKQLATELGHSVYLAQYYPQYKKFAFIEAVRSKSALQYLLDIGVLNEIHIAASGKSILSFLKQDVINEIISENISNNEEKEKLMKEIQMIRENGYAMTANERKEGALSVAAPIFDATKKVIGSIICVLPITEYKEEKKELYVVNVKRVARKISHLLGYLE